MGAREAQVRFPRPQPPFCDCGGRGRASETGRVPPFFSGASPHDGRDGVVFFLASGGFGSGTWRATVVAASGGWNLDRRAGSSSLSSAAGGFINDLLYVIGHLPMFALH